jgi:hypothetical protein
MTFVSNVECWSDTCVYVLIPCPRAKYRDRWRAVMDLPFTGNRCPSELDKVPVPNACVSGSR